jgi:hypothetical protein
MMREGSEGPGLDAAIHRLDRALGQLELRVNALVGQAEAANGELFELDRAHLAAELDAAKSRERELEAAGAEASAVLGQAIAELRAALSEDDPVETPAGQDGDYSAQDA